MATDTDVHVPLYQKKLTAAEVKAVDVSTGTVTAIVSDETPDRDSDIIRVSGWQFESFLKLPIMLADHDYSLSSAIGRWKNIRIEGTTVIGTAEYFVNVGNTLADKAFSLAQKGLAAFSVGFRTYPEFTKRLDSGGYEYTQQELLEISQVAVPANPNALAISKQIGPTWETDSIDQVGSLDDLMDHLSKIVDAKMKDLETETQRLESIITTLIGLADSVNQHMMYMIEDTTDEDVETDEEKPKPKPKPYATSSIANYLEPKIDRLIIDSLKGRQR